MLIPRKHILFFVSIFLASATIAYPQSWVRTSSFRTMAYVLASDPYDPSECYYGTVHEGFYKSTNGGLVWTPLNIPNASFSAVRFDPQSPGIVYALSYSGLYKSVDHGVKWAKIPIPLLSNDLAIDPQSPQILYLGGWWVGIPEQNGGVFKSINGGESWTLIGLDGYDIPCLAIDPENPLIIYAATRDDGIFRSINGGETWTAVNSGLTHFFCYDLSLDPNAPETLYVSMEGGGIFKTTNGGGSWSECNNGISDLDIFDIDVDSQSSLNLCAGAQSKVFISRDGGISWSEESQGFPEKRAVAVVIVSGSPLTVLAGTNGEGVYLYTEKPYISATPESLNFGYVSLSNKSPDQTFSILNLGAGTFDWTVREGSNWLSCSPLSGRDEENVKVSVEASGLIPGTYTSTISVVSSEALNQSSSITVKLKVYAPGTDNPPFGSFDTPTDGSLVSGSVAVTGWALDDIGVKRVEIKREPDPDDPDGAIGSDGLVYIGEAFFVKDARPDVEGLYFDYPSRNKAGWGYMMLTYGLPRKGNGAFRLYAIAEDFGGNKTRLGIKEITSDNAHRVKPFGAVDTPDPGEVASGVSFVNFGWALTPPPNIIPTDGLTIWVAIDSVLLGHPVYNQYRADVAAGFPECLNRNGAVGYYFIDTTQFANGIHTIGWLAYDNAGNGDGMGSRFFEIKNPIGAAAAKDRKEKLSYSRDTTGRLKIEVVGPTGFEVEEMERIEIVLKGREGKRFIGWGANRSMGLPVGSTLNKEIGVFSWMPGPGFLGKHILHFSVTDGVRMSRPVSIAISIVPKKYTRDFIRKRAERQP